MRATEKGTTKVELNHGNGITTVFYQDDIKEMMMKRGYCEEHFEDLWKSLVYSELRIK